MSKLGQAIAFAATAHREQVRKYTGEPYILHPLEVLRFLPAEATQQMKIAAVLHDVVEDTPVTLEEIKGLFGWEVELYVDHLTDKFTKEAYPNWNRKVRKEAERNRLAQINAHAQTVKYCDILSNTQSLVDHDLDFARVYLDEMDKLLQVMTKGDEGTRAGAVYVVACAQERVVQKALEKKPHV